MGELFFAIFEAFFQVFADVAIFHSQSSFRRKLRLILFACLGALFLAVVVLGFWKLTGWLIQEQGN